MTTTTNNIIQQHPQPADFQHVFRSVAESTRPEKGELIGQLPSWLNGTYLRVGPGRFDFENDFMLNHIFDGYSVVTKFNFFGSGGSGPPQVTVENKYLQTEVYKKVIRAQRPVICEYATRGYADPGKSLLSRLIPNLIPELTDNTNMALYQLGGSLMAGCETCHFHEIQANNLEVTSKFDASKLFGTNTWTCHPLRDAETGITYNIGASILTGIKYNVVQIPPDHDSSTSAKDLLKRSKILCSFPSSWYGCFSHTHSFGMTKKYLVFIEQPFVLLASKILAAVMTKGHCIQDWLEWRPELKNNFWLIEKETGRVHKVHYQSEEAFFFLHIVNCYEDSGNIVIDLLTFPSPAGIESMTTHNLRNGLCAPLSEHPRGQRFILPLFKNYNQAAEICTPNLITTIPTRATAVLKRDTRTPANSVITVTPETITAEGLELPTVNPAYIGQKYKYFYATASAMAGGYPNAICKINSQTKETRLWRNMAPCYSYLGEPLFIPRPPEESGGGGGGAEDENNNVCGDGDDDGEDDGVILCSGTTAGTRDGSTPSSSNKDFLVCLDARTFTEMGRVNFQSHIPQGLHGIFLRR